MAITKVAKTGAGSSHEAVPMRRVFIGLVVD